VKEYVVKNEDGYRIADSRVSLDSIVNEFNRGASPESIQRSFSTLTLEKIYGALAFYLANHDEVDKYLTESEKDFAALRSQSKVEHRAWYERLQKAREETLVS
jgi:uncharacterized protein (DUF433 family)